MDENSEPTVFRASHVSVEVGGRALLSGVCLTLSPGMRVGLRGPSGCGKTSLLRVLAGLDDAAGGRIALEDRTPEDLGWPVYRRRVVYVAQQPVFAAGTVEANLRRPFTYHHSPGGYPAERARNLMDALGLPSREMASDPHRLSVGQQQRVALVRGLLLEPAVLLLDEPTSALDEESRDRVEDVVREQCESQGAAAVVVSHDAAQGERWCHRVLDLAPHVAGADAA